MKVVAQEFTDGANNVMGVELLDNKINFSISSVSKSKIYCVFDSVQSPMTAWPIKKTSHVHIFSCAYLLTCISSDVRFKPACPLNPRPGRFGMFPVGSSLVFRLMHNLFIS